MGEEIRLQNRIKRQLIWLSDSNFRINYLPNQYLRIKHLPNQDLRIKHLPNQDPLKTCADEDLYAINTQPIRIETRQKIDCRACIRGLVKCTRLLDSIDMLCFVSS